MDVIKKNMMPLRWISRNANISRKPRKGQNNRCENPYITSWQFKLVPQMAQMVANFTPSWAHHCFYSLFLQTVQFYQFPFCNAKKKRTSFCMQTNSCQHFLANSREHKPKRQFLAFSPTPPPTQKTDSEDMWLQQSSCQGARDCTISIPLSLARMLPA